MLLSNRVAIVTGGVRGIGKGIALKFAEEGCSTVIVDVLAAEGKEAVEEASRKGKAGLFVECDVSNGPQVREMVDHVITKFGKVDILVNNAGIGPPPKSIENISDEEWVPQTILRGLPYFWPPIFPAM
jgi:NAD(P)-dependent dehydrogenase (short-subunit alcohol dehydrogenase family)